ncbi:MAG: tetratricopeptide repeat protein [Chloroflexi bacterium]|nr:MAG: tetratricopeptide repeat protein [Chloroflexota bacterium]
MNANKPENDTALQARFEALFRRGTEMLHAGQADKAISVLKKAHALNPEHIDAALNLSAAYILTRQFRLAVPILEKLTEIAPDNAMIWTNLGAAYLGNPILASDEDQQRAIAAFEQALAIDPIAPNVAYNLGLIYRDRQEYETAKKWFRRAIQANPRDRDAHALLQKLENKTDQNTLDKSEEN